MSNCPDLSLMMIDGSKLHWLDTNTLTSSITRTRGSGSLDFLLLSFSFTQNINIHLLPVPGSHSSLSSLHSITSHFSLRPVGLLHGPEAEVRESSEAPRRTPGDWILRPRRLRLRCSCSASLRRRSGCVPGEI